MRRGSFVVRGSCRQPTNDSQMMAMPRGSVFVPHGAHPRWVRCDAAIGYQTTGSLGRMVGHKQPKRGRRGDTAQAGEWLGPSASLPNMWAWWWRCAAALTGHRPRKTNNGRDATRHNTTQPEEGDRWER
eukprot:gene12885-biopygen2653